MKAYPIMLDVRGRVCVVVGAGSVGLRRARGLAKCGAAVRLVAPDAPADVAEGIQFVAASYEKSHLAGAALVLACTGERGLNARIVADARAAGALANAADQPDDCDFHLPAVARDGDVVVAVGTGGAAPALAAVLKDELAGRLPERLGEFAEALARVRLLVHERMADPACRRSILRALAGRAGLTAFAEAGQAGLTDLAEKLTEAK